MSVRGRTQKTRQPAHERTAGEGQRRDSNAALLQSLPGRRAEAHAHTHSRRRLLVTAERTLSLCHTAEAVAWL